MGLPELRPARQPTPVVVAAGEAKQYIQVNQSAHALPGGGHTLTW